jgi:hypothetical protein
MRLQHSACLYKRENHPTEPHERKKKSGTFLQSPRVFHRRNGNGEVQSEGDPGFGEGIDNSQWEKV